MLVSCRYLWFLSREYLRFIALLSSNLPPRCPPPQHTYTIVSACLPTSEFESIDNFASGLFWHRCEIFWATKSLRISLLVPAPSLCLSCSMGNHEFHDDSDTKKVWDDERCSSLSNFLGSHVSKSRWRKVDSQLQSRIRRHVPKDSSSIYVEHSCRSERSPYGMSPRSPAVVPTSFDLSSTKFFVGRLSVASYNSSRSNSGRSSRSVLWPCQFLEGDTQSW